MYFTIIPQHVIRLKKLGDARFLYGHILTLSNKVGYCYAHNNFLAEVMEVDTRTISRYVKALEEADLITVSFAKNNSRTIQAIDTFVSKTLLKRENKHSSMEIGDDMNQALETIWKNIK